MTTPRPRIEGIDLARCLAIAAMVVVNGRHSMAVTDPDPAWLETLVRLPEGRASALFVLLAGLGAIGSSWAWRARFARGPLEAVMRRVCG